MHTEMTLEEILHTEIPISKAMGVKVLAVSESSASLSAPLAANINHKHTAFGGSLYSLCVLSGWSLLYWRLHLLGVAAHIVIQESRIRYLKPVGEDMLAIAKFDDVETVSRQVRMFRRKARARFSLNSTIYAADELAVSFTGTYVIHA